MTNHSESAQEQRIAPCKSDQQQCVCACACMHEKSHLNEQYMSTKLTFFFLQVFIFPSLFGGAGWGVGGGCGLVAIVREEHFILVLICSAGRTRV